MRIGLKVVGTALLLAAGGEITSAEAASPAPVVSHPTTSTRVRVRAGAQIWP